ncbi:hypothetical protein [Streptomyces sp. 5112.2]|uniref:hypothetical protein n=1 Tax=unclassified Streptomyces TaxID=2593676 RepID=UPI0015A07AA2|nr:hypothetical protein [Streptomyces sp. 5112.2]
MAWFTAYDLNGTTAEDRLKSRDLRVGESFATRPRPVAPARHLWRGPVRGLWNTVLAHPGPRDPADRLLKAVGGLLSRPGRPVPGRSRDS